MTTFFHISSDHWGFTASSTRTLGEVRRTRNITTDSILGLVFNDDAGSTCGHETTARN